MEKLFAIIFAVATLLFFSFLMSWPVYMLWNGCLVDAITVTKEVTWLQAWGISFLFSILFKPSTSSK